MSGRAVEETIQAMLVAHALARGLFVFHPPNGGRRTAREGAAFKRIGVVAGIPDLVFLMPGGVTVFVEVKTLKGKLSDVQKVIHARLIENGFEVYVAQGGQHGLDIIDKIAEEAGC